MKVEKGDAIQKLHLGVGIRKGQSLWEKNFFNGSRHW